MADKQETIANRRPLEQNEVVIHVPPGYAKNVRVVESPDAGKNTEITVQVSQKRKAERVPMLGVIVK